MFGGVGKGFCDNVVARQLDGLGEATINVDIEADRQHRSAGQCFECRA